MAYTIAFGLSDPPPLATTTVLTRYTPILITDTVYYWLITASDGLSTSVGPVEYPIYLPVVLHSY